MNDLTRIDDRCWRSYIPEIKPDKEEPEIKEARFHSNRYEIVHIAKNLIEALTLDRLSKQTTRFQVRNFKTLEGTYSITIKKTDDGRIHNFVQSIPFFRRLGNRKVVEIRIDKETDSIYSKITGLFQKATTLTAPLIVDACDVQRSLRAEHHSFIPIVDRLHQDPFDDPFTQVATDAFQHWEPHWVHVKDINCKNQIILHGDELSLEPNKGAPETFEQEHLNRETVLSYKKFVTSEYGEELLKRLQHRYGFNLDDLILSGQPLEPEHVYRVNIGVNDIEQRDVDALFLKLKKLSSALKGVNDKTLITRFFEDYNDSAGSKKLSVREMRGITKQLSPDWKERTPSVKELRLFLKNLSSDTNKSESLEIVAFNKLMKILMPPKEVLDNLFTGRKIVHVPIMGFYSLAEKKHYKPVLDFHEALQVFSHCEKEDWYNFYELATHVFCKKHFIRTDPDNGLSVGTLVPGPKTIDGQIQWYRFDSCCDDDYGDFNYTMIPAHKSESMPHIKLYRSTASDIYQLNGFSSLKADLRPLAPPGGGGRKLADQYELNFFLPRTIPLWVGYWLKANKLYEETLAAMEANNPFNLLPGDPAAPSIDKHFSLCYSRLRRWRDVVNEYEEGIKPLYNAIMEHYTDVMERGGDKALDGVTHDELPKKRREVEEKLESIHKNQKAFPDLSEIVSVDSIAKMAERHDQLKNQAATYSAQLKRYAILFDEMPENKIPCDVIFAGHSLGGALAQGGMHHFATQLERLPLPGHRFVCYASDAPAVSDWEAKQFLKFGKKHENLITFLGPQWKVFYQMEYGDFVPQSGESHLGAIKGDPKEFERWLKFRCRVFQPLEKPEITEIRDGVTHGRRTGQGLEGRDFKYIFVTPKGLALYDHNWALTTELKKTWGYKFLNSAKVSEGLRRAIGWVKGPIYTWPMGKFQQWKYPQRWREFRDDKGILYCDYQNKTKNSWRAPETPEPANIT